MSEIELNDSRKELLETTGNTIVLGGPGSGKTTIALIKANKDIRAGLLKAGQQILFLSFARSTIARVTQHSGNLFSIKDNKFLEINTYHGFIWNLLRSHGYLLRDGRGIKLIPPPEAAAHLTTIGVVENKDLQNQRIKQEKERLFEEDGLLHFDLFARLASTLLTNSNSLCKIICDAYPFIIIDEFQDTNEEEWAFICALGKHSRFMALADPEQRIYEFRGADPKRIPEFMATFKPQTFDFGIENHRSNGTDIAVFGNDLLSFSNKGKSYKNVTVLSYGYYFGKNALFPLKAVVIQSIRRLIKSESKNWALAILVPTKQLMLQVSDYLSSEIDGLPPLIHEVALDAEAPALSAVLIAALLEGGVNRETIAQRLIENLCTHIRGRKGSKPLTQLDTGLVKAFEAYLKSGEITGSKRKKIIEAAYALADTRFQLDLSGDAGNDWLIIRNLLASSGIETFVQVATDAKYLRLLHKGATLRSRLSELWRSTGGYIGAENAIRDALLQEHFAASIKEWKGIHIMTIHKSKGKEFSEVVIYEGTHAGKYLRTGASERDKAQALLALRVAITRAMKHATLLTPNSDRCPFL